MSTEAQLVDLPEDEQKPKVNICTPKIIIVSILALYFASQNLYHYITLPVPQTPPPKIEVDEWKQFWQLFDRFQSYLYITVIGFIVFYYLRRENDKFEEEQYLKQLKMEEEILQEEKRKQHEREEKILKKLEEEEKQAQLKQFKVRQNVSQQSKPNTEASGSQNKEPKTEDDKKKD